MAISSNDCLSLLAELNDDSKQTRDNILYLLKGNEPTIEIISYINSKRQLDITRFYEKIRKSYNQKKSKLYINIVKEIDNPLDVITTLSAMFTQIILFSKDLEDRQQFLSHSRAEEISRVLTNYCRTYDITNAIKLLKLIKADIKCLEYISKNEE